MSDVSGILTIWTPSSSSLSRSPAFSPECSQGGSPRPPARRERAAAERAELTARAVSAEAARSSLGDQLDQQRAPSRASFGAQVRSDQAAQQERERREQVVLRALAPVQETLLSMQPALR